MSKKVIGFVTAGLAFNGDTIKKEGLGGSETACLYMAKELAARGHEVKVYCECPIPGRYDGVDYAHYNDYQRSASVLQFDVLIVSRFLEFLQGGVEAGLRLLWLHDLLVPERAPALMGATWGIDMLMCVSDFHKQQHVSQLKELEPWIWSTTNGVDLDLINKHRHTKIPGKMMFCSRPERGLPNLIQNILPLMLQERPDLRLCYCNYGLQNMKLPDHVINDINNTEELAKQFPENVFNLGHLSKAKLYEHMSSSELILAPSGFPESSCCAEGTLIQMPCDRSKHPYGVPIESLVGKSGFPVYAYDSETDEFILETCEKVWKTDENRECLDIELDDGNVLTVTPDHLIMDFNGVWHRADELKDGDRLNALHMRYDVCYKGRNGRWGSESRLLGGWKEGRKLGSKEHVHHKDGTRLNHEIDMVEVLDASKHRSLTFKNNVHSSKHRHQTSEGNKAFQNKLTPEERSERARKRSMVFWDDYNTWPEDKKRVWKEHRSKASKAGKKNPPKIKENPQGMAFLSENEIKEAYRRVKLYELSVAGAAKEYGTSLISMQSIVSKKTWKWLTDKVDAELLGVGGIAQNHRIISIRKSEKLHTVYDMQVRRVHNFIANGVVVHNCIVAMEAQACGTPFIGTKDFALVETVEDGKTGILIPGRPHEYSYINKFVQTCLRLMEDKEHYNYLSKNGPESIIRRGLTWAAVAASWDKKFDEMLGNRLKNNYPSVIKALTRKSDLMSARQLASHFGMEYKHDALNNEVEKTLLLVDEQKDPSTVASRFKDAVPRFKRVTDVLGAFGYKPTNILDFACGDTQFGLAAKQFYPNAKVTCVDHNPEIIELTNTCVAKGKLDVSAVLSDKIPDGEKYDLIFIGNYIDNILFPEKFLSEAAEHLTDDGFIVTTTRFGQVSSIIPESHDRVWNFGMMDFKHMFGKSKDFSASFIEDKQRNAGEAVGHWICAYRNNDKIPAPLLDRKWEMTRPYQSLACCMIVKNEENNLGRCLASVKDYVDKLIVVDTGSTDDTVSIAKKYGAEVRHLEFDNFGDSRNESIRDVGTDWIIWVDADEVLTNGSLIKKYCETQIYNGFVCKQVHMIRDMAQSNGQPTFDTPVRVFRNLPEYKFTGKIHEHCENTSKKPFDDPIHPSLVLPEVELLHYGYPNETIRRYKCSNRNLRLLIEDVKCNPTRMLNWVLVIRDYLNIVKWHMEKSNWKVEQGSVYHNLLNAAVATSLKYFSDEKEHYYPIVYPMYQQALEFLGRNGLKFENQPSPPFEVALVLTGAVGGLSEEGKRAGTKSLWFINHHQAMLFLLKKSASLMHALGVAPADSYQPDVDDRQAVQVVATYDPAELLAYGLDVMPAKVSL